MIGNAITYAGQLGWKSQLGLVIYVPPIAIWGLGTAEGAVRTAFNGVASIFSERNSEDAKKYWAQFKRDRGITVSSAALTVISLVPIIGTGFGYREYNNQCRQYATIKAALEEYKHAEFLPNLDKQLKRLDESTAITEQALNQMWSELSNPSIKTSNSELHLDLRNSLIHNYYGYSITYIALEKTTATLQFTADKVKQVIIYLSRNNIIKKVAICAGNAIVNEVTQTLDDTVKNRRDKNVIHSRVAPTKPPQNSTPEVSTTTKAAATTDFNITHLPVDAVFKIFFDVAQSNFQEASLFPTICKKWRDEAQETPIYRIFISKKYPNIDLNSLGADNFKKAFTFSNQMTYLAHAFSKGDSNLLEYNSYKKRLYSLLKEHQDFLPTSPYFDLRPFAWLDQKSWIKTYNHFAPLLTNVQVLEVKGIGHTISHQNVKLGKLPVLTEVAGAVKNLYKDFAEHSGVTTQSQNAQKTRELLLFCIGVIGTSSLNLTKLDCNGSSLTYDDVKWIKQRFPSL